MLTSKVKEKKKEYSKQYYQANKEKLIAKQKQYYQDQLDDTCNLCHANEYETSIVEDEQGKLVCSDCYYERNETELLCFLSCANKKN